MIPPPGPTGLPSWFRNNATGYSSVPCCSNPSLTSAPTESPRVYRSQGVAGETLFLDDPGSIPSLHQQLEEGWK